MNERTVKVCPNCGRQLTGQEFLVNLRNLSSNFALSVDPVAGRFLCPDCDYSGPFLEMTKEQFKDAIFEKKKIEAPLNRGNPLYFRVGLGALGLLLFYIFLRLFFPNSNLPLIMLVLSGFICLYAELKLKKFSK